MRKRSLLAHGNAAIRIARNVIKNLTEENGFSIEYWAECYATNIIEKCFKPTRYTLLHDYIANVYLNELSYTLDKHCSEVIVDELEELFDFYKVDYKSVNGYDNEDREEDEEYASNLFDFFQEKLLVTVVDDTFSVLYNNKNFLYSFSMEISSIIGELKIEDYPEFLRQDGVMKRGNEFPVWLKTGVRFRDGGRCQICGTDLTKIMMVGSNENYDHVIPLKLDQLIKVNN